MCHSSQGNYRVQPTSPVSSSTLCGSRKPVANTSVPALPRNCLIPSHHGTVAAAVPLPGFFPLFLGKDAVDPVVCINRVIHHLATQILDHLVLLVDRRCILFVRVVQPLQFVLD